MGGVAQRAWAGGSADRRGDQINLPSSNSRRASAAVEVSAEECPVEVLPAMDVVGKLFQGSSWDCSQSDNGQFAGRLADILGGPGTPVANQPAVREALVSTVRSPTGKTVRQLLDTAKKHGGSWPKRLLWNRDPDTYAQQVVNLLLYRKLLRPHLSVRCPESAITTTMRPEDLSTLVSCEMYARSSLSASRSREASPPGLALPASPGHR